MTRLGESEYKIEKHYKVIRQPQNQIPSSHDLSEPALSRLYPSK